MGYNVEYEGQIMIKADKKEECLKAINALHHPEELEKNARGGTFQGGEAKERWYSWVTNPGPEGFPDLDAAFKAWNLFDDAWVNEEADGCVSVTGGYYCKLGQQEVLLEAIAPFLENTQIECRGEDGALWMWDIKDGELDTKYGTITYGE